jgi:hypothetical protein
MFASRLELAITLGMDRLLSTFKHVTWSDVANRTVQSLFVVLRDELGNDSLSHLPDSMVSSDECTRA